MRYSGEIFSSIYLFIIYSIIYFVFFPRVGYYFFSSREEMDVVFANITPVALGNPGAMSG